jgi:hypothetical protein
MLRVSRRADPSPRFTATYYNKYSSMGELITEMINLIVRQTLGRPGHEFVDNVNMNLQ